MGKKGQVSIFIIIAILIVVGILVYFLWIKPTYVDKGVVRLKGFDGCVQDAVEGELGELGVRGGYIAPEFSYLHNSENVAYLCYTNLYYKPCVVQQPFLKQHFAGQLKMAISEKVNKCYEGSISELQSKGYDVQAGVVSFEVELEPRQVVVQIRAPTSVSSGAGSQRFESFSAKVRNSIYEMLMIATSIL